jgi:hypothetical protein
MGKYFNPPNDESLVKAGRKLDYDSRNYSNLKALLKEGENLVGLFDRGINKVAPFLPDESEYEEFMKQYRSGQFIDVDFYAVIEKNIPKVQNNDMQYRLMNAKQGEVIRIK